MFESYGDAFEMYLNDLLRDEGSLERRRLFEEFVAGSNFFCGRCGEEFETEAEDVEEDDHVLCPRCAKKGRG